MKSKTVKFIPALIATLVILLTGVAALLPRV
jgi:hypothetical protein